MNQQTLTRTYGCLILGTLLAAGALPAGERTLTIFEGRRISVSFPEGWLLEEATDPRTLVQTARVVNPQSEIQLDMSFYPDPQGQLERIDRLKATVQEKYSSYLRESVEKEMKITTFAGTGGIGAFTAFTDRKLAGKPIPPGERLISTTGLLTWKGAYLMFTLRSNSNESDEYRLALDVVRRGVQEIATVQVEAADPQGFTVRSAPWILKLPGTGSTIREQKVDPNGTSGYFAVTDKVTGLNVSFFIEPAEECTSSPECAALKMTKGFADLGEVKDIDTSVIDGVSVVECFLEEVGGSAVMQQNMFAEFVVQGYWVDMHISKSRYKPTDHELFEGFVRAVSFMQKEKSK